MVVRRKIIAMCYADKSPHQVSETIPFAIGQPNRWSKIVTNVTPWTCRDTDKLGLLISLNEKPMNPCLQGEIKGSASATEGTRIIMIPYFRTKLNVGRCLQGWNYGSASRCNAIEGSLTRCYLCKAFRHGRILGRSWKQIVVERKTRQESLTPLRTRRVAPLCNMPLLKVDSDPRREKEELETREKEGESINVDSRYEAPHFCSTSVSISQV